jgi:hypothetical protein
VVYFPAGTYLISSSIFPAYFTQLIGDASAPPTLKATAGFAGFGLIDGNPYYTEVLSRFKSMLYNTPFKLFGEHNRQLPIRPNWVIND